MAPRDIHGERAPPDRKAVKSLLREMHSSNDSPDAVLKCTHTLTEWISSGARRRRHMAPLANPQRATHAPTPPPRAQTTTTKPRPW